MHTENTEKELSVFSGCIFSVAGMCTGRTKISPYKSTLSNRFSRMNQSNFGIQVYSHQYRGLAKSARPRLIVLSPSGATSLDSGFAAISAARLSQWPILILSRRSHQGINAAG